MWGLGITLFCLLTLSPPFHSDNRNELFSMIKNDPIPWDKYKNKFSKNAAALLKSVEKNFQ